MRTAYKKDQVKTRARKGVQEGSEETIEWPATIASADGIVSKVTNKKIQFKRDEDNRTISYQLIRTCDKGETKLNPLVKKGEAIFKDQIIASLTPVYNNINCAGNMSEKEYREMLLAKAISDRYAAAKALSYFDHNIRIASSLINKLNQKDEHIYVKLEAAASLMRNGNKKGVEFIKKTLKEGTPENRLETVIILGEINSPNSIRLLTETLHNEREEVEIRAGVAWALGEIGNSVSINTLIDSFINIDDKIKAEAARALAKIGSKADSETVSKIIKDFPEHQDQKMGVAWALSKMDVPIKKLTPLFDEHNAIWGAYIIGQKEPKHYIEGMESIKDSYPKVYFGVNLLWNITSGWIDGLRLY